MPRLNLDCLLFIFNELHEDIKSLHSCILVNRDWCQVAVPILWKYSWCSEGESERKLFNTILSLFPLSSKLLIAYGIKFPIPIFIHRPLFNYISLCQFPG